VNIGYQFSGRTLYAIAIIGFGVVCLVYGDFVNSLQPMPASMSGYRFLAIATGILLIVLGLAIVADFKIRLAALVLAALFVLWIVLLHIPRAFTNPESLRSPWWIATFETVALAGTALILAARGGDPIRDSWVRTGRIAFGISLPVFGVLHVIYPENVAALITTATPQYPWPLFWAYLTGLGHFAAGIAIATGVMARWAAILSGCMYASWALTLHLVRVIDHPAARTPEYPAGYGGDRGELTSLFVCVAFWGAAWIVASSVTKLPRKTLDA
jgi:uncharacterized membrane protein YphA (DoxX/SURF4 family)